MSTYLTLILFLVICFLEKGTITAQVNDFILSSSTAVQYQNDQVQYSASMGEVLVSEVSNKELVLSQGFYQGEVILWEGKKQLNLNQLSVYPNPIFNTLKVKFEETGQCEYVYLIDALGNKLFSEQLSEYQLILTKDLSWLPSGYYFLNVIYTNGDLKTIKIFKAN